MDEGFIYARLKALGGGIEREQYRDISKAFAEVVRYNEKALEELEERLNRELRDTTERYYLYGAVTDISDAPIVNDFLFPVSTEENEESIGTFFFEGTKTQMEKIFSESQELILTGTDGAETEVKAEIKPCARYLDRVEELKKAFYDNGVCWRTPYLPYLRKFGDVYGENWEKGREIAGVRFKDGGVPVKPHLAPLWNVEKIKLKCTVFPVPAIDECHYRHTLRLPFSQDGYLVIREPSVHNVFYDEKGLNVVTAEHSQREFDLYRIAVKREVQVPHYPLTTNRRIMRHIDRQADYSAGRLNSRGELARIAGSYEVSGAVRLTAVKETPDKIETAWEEPYRYIPPGRRALTLSFEEREESFLNEDTVSFLAREAGEAFLQYQVKAELVKGVLEE